jgi:hypothetical protein
MVSQSLPNHLYVWVDSTFVRAEGKGFEPAVWFAVRSEPNRAWGCHVVLECGAVYRNLPPHSLAFSEKPTYEHWKLKDAQVWDCYGREFDMVRYTYLADLQARYDNSDAKAKYLFTACPHSDGFSMAPEQSKEFMFMQTAGDRLLIRPTNMLLFEERSFTQDTGWPTNIQTSTNIWECEND